MAFDSLVRLRQLNKPEVSGYTVEIIKQYLTTGTGLASIANTGALTGAFYPLHSNPSGYLNTASGLVLKTETGDFIDEPALAISNSQLLTGISGLYYPRSNPSGYIATGVADVRYARMSYPNGDSGAGASFILYDSPAGQNVLDWVSDDWFFIGKHQLGGAHLDVYGYNNGTPYISGFSIYSDDIKISGQSIFGGSSAFLEKETLTNNTKLYLYDTSKAFNTFGFESNKVYYLKGVNSSIIDLYDASGSFTTPRISGFAINATELTLNGVNIATGAGTGVSLVQLQLTSGALNTSIEVLRSQLVATGAKIPPPVSRPNVWYLNKHITSYNQKSLSGANTLSGLFTGFILPNSGINIVRVGTGNFGAVTINNTGLGQVIFENEFDVAPNLSFTLNNCRGKLLFTDRVSGSFTVTNSTNLELMTNLAVGEYVPLVQAELTNFTGTLRGFQVGELNLYGACLATVQNCAITQIYADAGLTSLTVSDSEINGFAGAATGESKVTVHTSYVGGRLKLDGSMVMGPFLSFNTAEAVHEDTDLYYNLVNSGWGGLTYFNGDLFLLKNLTGKVNNDQLITKASGDARYYLASNPEGYIDANYVSSNYASLQDAALLGPGIHNTSFYLADNTKSAIPFNFEEGALFLLTDTGNRVVVDFYAAKPYISGFRFTGIPDYSGTQVRVDILDAKTINLNGVSIQSAISGAAATGSMISMIDDKHNTRMALWHTGTLETGFYFSGGNGPYYLQNYKKEIGGGITFLNKIDLQNSIIQGFQLDALNLQIAEGTALFSDSLGFSALNWQDAEQFVLRGPIATLDLYGNSYGFNGGQPHISGFNISFPIITGGTGYFKSLLVNNSAVLDVATANSLYLRFNDENNQTVYIVDSADGTTMFDFQPDAAYILRGTNLKKNFIDIRGDTMGWSGLSKPHMSGFYITAPFISGTTGYFQSLSVNNSALLDTNTADASYLRWGYPNGSGVGFGGGSRFLLYDEPGGYAAFDWVSDDYFYIGHPNFAKIDVFGFNTDPYITGFNLYGNSGDYSTIKYYNFSGGTGQFGHVKATGIQIKGNNVVTGASNLGSASGIYSSLVGNELTFKSLQGGSGIRISGDGNTLTLIVTGIQGGAGGGEANTASNVGSGSGIWKQKTGVDLEFRSIMGKSGIKIELVTDTYHISVTGITGGGGTASFSPYEVRYYI